MRIAFYLHSLGELQFQKPVIKLLESQHPDWDLIILHNKSNRLEFDKLYGVPNALKHVDASIAFSGKFSGIDLFLTSEQYGPSLPGVYSICIFHGQPSKGLTFYKGIFARYDAFFLYGGLHRDALKFFLADNDLLFPETLTVFDVGYPKSDAIIAGLISGNAAATDLSLDTNMRTVLYAPAFNEGASLREYGTEILETLANCSQYNVVVKLPIDCWEPTSNDYATGGVDWFAKMAELEQRYNNIHFSQDYEIDPLLACADVLVTCISSVGFEFMALNKPVVFIETPKYFSQYLQKRMPELDVTTWANRTTVNGGKEFGLVVREVSELPGAIETVLRNPHEYPRHQEKLRSYLLYNPGKATERAVTVIKELITSRPISQRPVQRRINSESLFKKARNFLRSNFVRMIKHSLNALGYSVVRSGLSYIDSNSTVEAANKAGLSVNAYLESKESDKRKVGRRDLIIATMQVHDVFQTLQRVCEIGAGTGQYLEKTLELANPLSYEVYETDRGWVDFLIVKYGSMSGLNLRCHPADGRSLALTASDSIDLVQAHAVFVYLPVLQTMEYLKESVRVCRAGGFIVFDCILDTTLHSLQQVDAWLQTPHRFPVIFPHQLILEFANANVLQLVHQFEVVYGGGVSIYFIFRKPPDNSGYSPATELSSATVVTEM